MALPPHSERSAMPSPADEMMSPDGRPIAHTLSTAEKAKEVSNLSSFAQASLLMVMAMLLYSCVDTSVKLASQHVPTMQVVWFRFFAHFILAFAFLNPWRSPQSWKMNDKPGQYARVAVQILTAGLSFLALGQLQLSQTTTIQFTTPMFITLLSVMFLGERVGIWHWVGILLAFGGVLVVTQPGLAGFNWGFVASIASVFCAAIYNILTRHLSHTESPGSLLLVVGGVASAALLPVLPFVWVWPSSISIWLLLFAVGFFAAAGHYCLILAHRLAPASLLAPFQYIQFLLVIVLGYVFFNDIPTVWTFVGTAIIIVSGAIILRASKRTTEA